MAPYKGTRSRTGSLPKPHTGRLPRPRQVIRIKLIVNWPVILKLDLRRRRITVVVPVPSIQIDSDVNNPRDRVVMERSVPRVYYGRGRFWNDSREGTIIADDRVHTVKADDREGTVQADDREDTVQADDREDTIKVEDVKMENFEDVRPEDIKQEET